MGIYDNNNVVEQMTEPTAHTIVIKRRPKVKARPRHTKGGRVFTPKTTLEEEDHVKKAWEEQVGKTLAYASTSVLKNVEFSVSPKAALKIARKKEYRNG